MVMGSVREIRTSSVKGKRLRVKILVKKPANGACNVSEVPEVNCIKKLTSTDVGSEADAGEKKSKPTLGTKNVLQACQSSKQVPRANCLEKSSVTPNWVTTTISGKMLNPIAGCKRKNELEVIEICGSKKQNLNMDVPTTLFCYDILTILMKHVLSHPFHAPVDAKGLGLHDYFDIVKKPMDLGTIKEKFMNNHYLGAEQFEADIRLTFSNAMLYNPPGNWYHETAKKLLTVFDRLWKSHKRRIDRVDRDIKQKGSESCNNKIVLDVMEECLNSDRDHYTRKVLSRKQKESSPKKTAFDVKDENQESVSAHHSRFPGKALLRKEKSSEDLKKLSVEGQRSDLKAAKEKSHKLPPRKGGGSEELKLSVEGQHSDLKAVKGRMDNKNLLDVKDENLKSVSAHGGQFSGKALPRKLRSHENMKKLSVEGKQGDLKPVKGRSDNKNLFDVKDEKPERVSAHSGQFSGKALPRKVRSHEDMKKLSVEGKHSDLKTVKGRSDNKNLFDVKDENPESVSAQRGQCSGKALPRKVRSHEDMKTSSVEGKHSDLNAVKDGEPKLKPIRRNSLLSATKSVFSGPASQSACPTPAKVECEHAPRRKTAHDDVNAVKVRRRPLTSQRDSNVQSFVREDKGFDSFPTTTGSFDATVTDSWHLSPRALRVAKLKERFSETILKAQNHSLLEQGVRTDLQKGKVVQQRRQNEEKARIEAQIETVKSAARLETESKLQKQRRAERDAMEKMKQTVFFEDNLLDFKELEAIIGSPLVANNRKTGNPTSPLERLGLYIKEEYQIGDENDYAIPMDEDLEEGEIM